MCNAPCARRARVLLQLCIVYPARGRPAAADVAQQVAPRVRALCLGRGQVDRCAASIGKQIGLLPARMAYPARVSRSAGTLALVYRAPEHGGRCATLGAHQVLQQAVDGVQRLFHIQHQRVVIAVRRDHHLRTRQHKAQHGYAIAHYSMKWPLRQK